MLGDTTGYVAVHSNCFFIFLIIFILFQTSNQLWDQRSRHFSFSEGKFLFLNCVARSPSPANRLVSIAALSSNLHGAPTHGGSRPYHATAIGKDLVLTIITEAVVVSEL
jgi:hypothetical protein